VRGRWTPALTALLLANAVPLLGVIFLGWDVLPILLIFWSENVIIGVYNVLRMATAQPQDPGYRVFRWFMIPFFCVHFGMFTLVHGIFVLVLFGGDRYTDFEPSPGALFGALGDQHLWWAVGALFASHGVSFVANYLRGGEYRSARLENLMGRPYGRVIVLHITILVGGFLLMALDQPAAGLTVLVLLKIALDTVAHLRERKKLDPGVQVKDL